MHPYAEAVGYQPPLSIVEVVLMNNIRALMDMLRPYPPSERLSFGGEILSPL